MANTKSSSGQKGVMIPADAYQALMEFMAQTKKQDAISTEIAERHARREDEQQYRANIIGRLTNADMRAIRDRLDEVLQSCAAIHSIAGDAMCAENINTQGYYLKAIEEMARANVKGLDACIEKIAGAPHSGLFAEELEPEEVAS